MDKIIIGIDIDGVVNDLTLFHIACGTRYCFEHNIQYSITNFYLDSTNILNWDNYTDKNFWNCYYLQLLQNSKFIRPFVSEVTKQLIESGNKIIFITSRSDHDLPPEESQSMFQITKKYLHDNHIYYSELILSQCKEKVVVSKGIEMMIEDNPDFFNPDKILSDIPLLCFDTLYNSQITASNITRVYSWYDILQKISSIRKEQ